MRISDCVVSNEEYAVRAKELGHSIISSCEHYTQGRYIEAHELAIKYDLKFLFVAEAGWVKDRFEKDRSNCHIILAAKNENGRQAINDILSEANITGYYYQPRVDIPLILSLPPNDVWITSACVAGWKYEDADEIMLKFAEHFGNNFYLEVQNHNTDKQKELNKRIINLSNKHNIPIIFGCDSHYIYEEQAQERTDFLNSKGIFYEDEEGWFLNYPTGDEAYQRFKDQGVLTDSQIKEAMNNTNVFLEVEKYDNPIFTKDIKMPTLYPDKTKEEKDQMLRELVAELWEEEKKNIPEDRWVLTEEEIQKELQVIIDVNHSDYFLLDYYLIKESIKNGGKLTKSGRGSCISFRINKTLGFTTVDRLFSPVKMFPERFISKTRILETGSLVDIDINAGNPEVFELTQKQLLGDDHAFPMIAYGSLKPKAAWKMYARSQNVDFDISNEISKQIEKYDKALKFSNSEDDKDLMDVYDYIDPKYHEEFEQSEKYLGVIDSVSVHPCASILYNGSIRKEIGLIMLKAKGGKKEYVASIIDGKWAENYKMLKNDLLKVSVVDLIYKVFDRIGIEAMESTELIKLCENDQEVWDIYEKGFTLGINQVSQKSTSGRVAKYKPKNISELTAFIASIRPGFKSMYKTFESREPFTYGIKSIDDLIQTQQFPQSFILYQENQMAILNFSGIPMTECYDIIKNIAKKRVAKVIAYKDIFLKGFKEKMISLENLDEEKAISVSNDIWQIIEDSASYSFNACISKDTKIWRAGNRNKFDPTIEEMYFIMNDKEYARKTGHSHLYDKYNRYGYGNALSMCEDGRIRKNTIKDIRQAGVRKTYEVTTKSGASIICTDNHKFPTTNGKVKLEELKIGDLLYVKGKYEKNKTKYLLTDGNFEKNIPKKGQIGFQKMKDGAYVHYRTKRENCVKAKEPCAICGEVYSDNIRFEVHHKDGNRLNNDYDNLQWLCVSCHKKEHYKKGRRKAFEKGIPTFEDPIVSIEYSATEMTYDIEMTAPNHNFISQNGLVTSNSHAYCVAIDSLYGAYLKSHFPLQFYEIYLQLLEEKGDKNLMAEVRKEAERAFKVGFPPFKYRQDNRNIVADSSNNQITNSLKSIKGFNKILADFLYTMKDIQFDCFVDLLIYIAENGTMGKKIEELIKLQYFSEFGQNGKLLEICTEFLSGKNRYGKKLKEATKEKRAIALREFEQSLPNYPIKVKDQIDIEREKLGYIQCNYPELDKRNCYVIGLNTTNAPRVQIHCLKTGKATSVKIKRALFKFKKFEEGDVIYCSRFKEKPAIKYVDGKFEESDTETQLWVEKYEVVTKVFDKKLLDN